MNDSLGNVFYDLEGQSKRRGELKNLLLDAVMPGFTDEGIWTGENPELGGMAQLQRMEVASVALSYPNGCHNKAAAVIGACMPLEPNHFTVCAVLRILRRAASAIDFTMSEKLAAYVMSNAQISDRELDFLGYNDNFPALASYGCIVGGELLGERSWVETGLRRLNQLRELFTRRGFLSEFNSPNYIGITVRCLADIANDCVCGEAKRLALELESRVWFEILSHFHLPTSTVAGPYSRAYTVDSAAHASNVNAALYALLGDVVRKNPKTTVFTPIGGAVAHGCAAYMQCGQVFAIDTVFHCPVQLVEWIALGKSYPFAVTGTAEVGPSMTDTGEHFRLESAPEDMYECPACSGTVYTYMTRNYALGSSELDFIDIGATDSPHLVYLKNDRADVLSSIGSLYTRLLVNDSRPGQPNPVPGLGKTENATLLRDAGRKFSLQRDSTVMTIYTPKIYNTEITEMKLSLILPSMFSDVEEIWVGGRKAAPYEGVFGSHPVFIRDGKVYIAAIPTKNMLSIKLEKYNGFGMVSFYLCSGGESRFAPRELLQTGSGCVLEVRDSDGMSFEAFRGTMSEYSVSDECYTNRHARNALARTVRYERKGLSMETSFSPASGGIRYAAVNGKCLPAEKLWATGFDTELLPFM